MILRIYSRQFDKLVCVCVCFLVAVVRWLFRRQSRRTHSRTRVSSLHVQCVVDVL